VERRDHAEGQRVTVPAPRTEQPGPTSSTAPIERKVTAATLAALLSSAAVGEITALIGTPLSPVWAQLVTAAVTGLVTFAAGWLAKHTSR
jgi:hypothetical protein